jgi:DNA helicase-4
MSLNLSDEDYKIILDNILESGNHESNKYHNSEAWGVGKKFLTKSGIKVRSKIEKIIADFYFDLGIRFEYEKEILFPKLGNPKEKYKIYCDFYLPDYGIYHEHFGKDDPDYLKLADIKKSAFSRFSMHFICTSIDDELNIEESIADKLKRFGIFVE